MHTYLDRQGYCIVKNRFLPLWIFRLADFQFSIDKGKERSYYVSELGNLDTMELISADKSLQEKIFQMQCEICKSLAHAVRLQIVDRLNRGEASASELIENLGISKGNLSKHMSLLVQSGIVIPLRKGKRVFYRLSDPEIHKACSIMRTLLYNRLNQEGKLASAIKQSEADL